MADNRNFVNKFANQGGGDIFVEDAKLSEITTKSAITSEGVMLKGTDGAYYSIDKNSLSEVIRAELGAILADNSKNNGTSVGKVPTLNSSDNALGASSVADLASVLGATIKISDASAKNLNNYHNNGIYNTAEWANNPTGVQYSVTQIINFSGLECVQNCYSILDDVCYRRVYVNGAWKNWAQV